MNNHELADLFIQEAEEVYSRIRQMVRREEEEDEPVPPTLRSQQVPNGMVLHEKPIQVR